MVTIKMNALAKYGLLFAASCFLVAGWIVSPFPSLLGHPHTVLDGDAVSPPCTTPNLKTIFSRGGARLDPHDTVAMIKVIRPVAPTELEAEAAKLPPPPPMRPPNAALVEIESASPEVKPHSRAKVQGLGSCIDPHDFYAGSTGTVVGSVAIDNYGIVTIAVRARHQSKD
jgi:hypothetical protein